MDNYLNAVPVRVVGLGASGGSPSDFERFFLGGDLGHVYTSNLQNISTGSEPLYADITDANPLNYSIYGKNLLITSVADKRKIDIIERASVSFRVSLTSGDIIGFKKTCFSVCLDSDAFMTLGSRVTVGDKVYQELLFVDRQVDKVELRCSHELKTATEIGL